MHIHSPHIVHGDYPVTSITSVSSIDRRRVDCEKLIGRHLEALITHTVLQQQMIGWSLDDHKAILDRQLKGRNEKEWPSAPANS